MIIKKLSVSLIALMLLSISFGMLASDSAQAAFVQNLSNTNLPSTFVAYDTAWNEAGTMAVVVGFDSATTATNAYAYFPNNDTYMAIDNDGWNQQNLHAVDYFRQPIYDWPNILLVDADWDQANVVTFYSNALSELDAYVDVWDVWDNPSIDKGKPTATDMAGYDLVIWVPSRYMAGFNGVGDGLNYLDTLEIMEYLDGGGNFFLSNLAFSDFHSFAPGSLAADYLGVGGVNMNTNYEHYARPVAMDYVFGGLSEEWMNWGSYGWSGYSWSTDILFPGYGTACFECRDSMNAWATTGLRYDSGTFKTVYLGFPLETLSSYYAYQIFQNLLDWIMPQKGTLDQSNGNMDNPNWNYVMNHDSWAQSFMPDAETVSAVEFYMYSEGMNDYFTIEIRDDSGGLPIGDTLTTGYLYQSDIPQSAGEAGWVRCTFPSAVSVTVGNIYWIVCTQFDKSYNQNWLHDEGMSYLDGEAMRFTMGSWSYENYYDWIFRTYSSSAGSTPKTVSLSPTKDNTIYSENTGNSNGAGEYIIAGTDWYPHDRRTLLEFNIASLIPKYSTINSVGLSMYCSYAYNTDGHIVNLHMAQVEWGESTSDAPDLEENGIPAATGDATWDYAYYSSTSWMAGGDFGPSVASTWVTLQDTGYTWGSDGMRDNVQQWLDNPGTNHGWAITGEEYPTMGTAKWFNSRNNLDAGTRPLLSVTYTEPTVIGYEDVFWIAGDTYGPNPPATAYKLVPSEGMALIPMNAASTGQYYSVAIDYTGNPLFGTDGQYPYLYYYDGAGWIQIPSPTDLTGLDFTGLDFNPNDRRFYATGMDFAFYTDPAPLIGGESRCYQFNHFPNLGGSLFGELAWNNLYDYGLVGGDACLVKIWPYDEYGNGTVRYETETTTNVIHDISWDSDEWNEAGLVGMTTTGNKGYWRYYNSNPQIIPGSVGATGTYYACAMKPPSSPKWLLIPSGAGSVRINIEEKDESGELVISSEFPHIFTMDMWKQSDVGGISTMNTQVSTDSTYTFAFEGNYTRDGIDRWADLDVFITGWFDYGLTGINSQPGDPGWTLDNYRNSQFNLTFDTGTQTAGIQYPAPLAPAGEEFSIDSFWQDTATYGPDNSHHRLYINVTFGPQMLMANGPGTPAIGNNIWDRASALNDIASWDLRFFIRDSTMTSAYNITYNEFGVQRYASVSVSGNPSGSIPPGAAPTQLLVPTTVTYSTNVQYKLNVSIPNLYRNGNPLLNFIAPTYVQVWNDHSNAPGNSNISVPTAFNGPNLNQIIWGSEFTWIQPVGSGTESAGPQYSDYTAALVPEPFEVTEVWWTVEVPVGTTEGVYRGTITITLWS